MITNSKEKTEDKKLDFALRPRTFNEFVGQKKTKENLSISIKAAMRRKEPIEHLLLYGPPGTGKTSLSHLVAREMKANIKITSGPAIEKIGDLAAILTNLGEGDILFIDEFHRINKLIEETLYPAMEDFALDIIIGKGPSARTLRLDLPHFTLIGATTRIGLLSSPLRDRFGITYRLNSYEIKDIEKIVKHSSRVLKIKIKDDGIEIIAKRARGIPRIANRILKRVRDFAEVKGEGIITEQIANSAMEALEVDSLGLELTDRKILEIMINRFNGRPVGLKTLAAATSEEQDTIEDIYEPYLLQIGFLVRTPRGRIPTKLAYEHLGKKYNCNVEENTLL